MWWIRFFQSLVVILCLFYGGQLAIGGAPVAGAMLGGIGGIALGLLAARAYRADIEERQK